ncbi:MAG: hypothetical protein IKT05_07280 [Fibrobacter sp.]|nr:hypothetical protein [Fibrobacter sp.]
MNSAVKGLFILALSSLCLTACGGDSSGSTKPTGDDELESSESNSGTKGRSSSSWAMSSATTVIDADAKDVRNTEHSHDSEVDSATGTTYTTHSVGIYTWTEQNLNVKSSVARNTCYAYDDSKCNPYGRLYLSSNAEKVCPAGYTLPTVAEWKDLLQAELSKTDYAGICTKRDTLECTGIGDSVRYLANNGYAVLMDRSGLFETQMARDNEFYSLRCIRYRSIVERMADLPDCEENRFNNDSRIYVVDRDSSYYCSSNGKWYASNSKGVCNEQEDGDKYLIKGYVYICKNGSWRFTTIDDVDIKCTDDNRYEEYVVNDVRYACGDNGMTKLTYPATELGFCSPKIEGKIADLDSTTSYICKNFKWNTASFDDYHGTCDSTSYGKMVDHKDGKSYVCSQYKRNWREATSDDKEFGPCTSALKDSIRMTESHVYLTCSVNEWFLAKDDVVLGKCTGEREGEKILIRTTEYECHDNNWVEIDPLTKNYGFCTVKAETGKKGVYRDTVYYCKAKITNGYGWTKANEFDLLLGYCEIDSMYQIVNKDNISYRCANGIWKYAEKNDVLHYCKWTDGTRKVYNGHEYVCDTTALQSGGNWYALTALDSALGEYCRTAILGKVVEYNDTVYVCKLDTVSKDRKKWQVGSFSDRMKNCDKDNLGKRVFNGVDTVVCIYNSCSGGRERTYAYNGKDTEICGKYNITGYFWEAIVRESITDKRDGEVYGVLTFGTQKWLNRDLQYWITSAYGGDGYKLTVNPYEFEPDMYHSFYYVWSDALGGSNICPAGTHIPSKADWKTLFEFAEKLKPGEGVISLLDDDWRVSRKGKDYFGFGLRRNGFMNMDYYPPGNNPMVGDDDYMSLYYWTTDAGSATSMGNAVRVDTLLNVNYQVDALKEDAYTIRCIVD